MAETGVRVNGQKTLKPAAPVAPGDVLTFVQGREIRVVRVLSLAVRRGPAREARTLFEDIGLPKGNDGAPPARVGPRPTKKARRTLDNLRDDIG